MSQELFLDLIVNVALYCMATVIYGRMIQKFDRVATWQKQLAIGLVLGLTAVVGMTYPVRIMEGVVFDGRAIAVAAAGLFGGGFGAIVAVLPPAIYRLELGGAGVTPGLVNLVLSAALGVAARRWVGRQSEHGDVSRVILVACLLPVAGYLAFLFFPSFDMAWMVFKKVGLTLAIMFPVGFAVLSLLLLDARNRHQLVMNLRSKEALFDALHADIPAMLFQRTLTPDGLPEFRYISPSAKRLLDRTPEEIYQNPALMISAIHPDDRADFLSTLRKAETEGKLPNHEYRSVSKDGLVRWLRVSASGAYVDGEYLWNGVTIDITNLKEAEQRQYELAQIFSDSAVAIIRTDAEFNVRYFNDAAARLYGYSVEEAIGSPAAMFRPPEMVEKMTGFMTGLKARREPGSIRTISLHKTGRRIPTRLDMSPLFDANRDLTGWSAMCLDMSEQQAAEDELNRMATTDALTGLPNRRSFGIRAEEEIGRSRRYKRPLSLMMADIDFFKRINDEYGHAAGDRVLIKTAQVFTNALRSSGDFVARIGGEEFAVLLPECDSAGAELLAERLRIAIAAMEVDVDDGAIRTQCSFGVADWQPTEDTVDAALQRADAALYQAKSEGRNCVKVAPPIAALTVQAGGRATALRDHRRASGAD